VASRRPARRSSRKSTKVSTVTAATFIGIVTLLNFHAVVDFLVTACVVGLAVAAYLKHPPLPTGQQLTAAPWRPNFQAMTWQEFEHALADLCRRDGCTNVQVVGGSGDHAADVIANTPDGRRIVIQAKRFGAKTVGSEDVQKVNGTYRDFHHAQLAAIVTTSRFTKAALADARHVGIRAFDGAKLASWASRTGPAPWH
jgi:restriction system protein